MNTAGAIAHNGLGRATLLALALIVWAHISAAAQQRLGTETPLRKEEADSLRLKDSGFIPRLGLQQTGEAQSEIVRRSAPARVASGPEALIDEADRMVKEGKLERAVATYRKVIDKHPKLTSAHLGLGYAYFKMGDFNAAARAYKEAVEYDNSSALAQLNLGVALYAQGRTDEAISAYQQAIVGNHEELPVAHFNLAVAYSHQGDFDKAIRHYESAIKMRKQGYPEAHNNLGLVYEATGDLAAAAQNFRLAVSQKRGRYPLALYNMARCAFLQGRYDQAISGFNLAIEQQSGFAEAYLDLGNVYLIRTTASKTNELDLAINNYRRALAVTNGNYPLAHENLAVALTKKGMREEALKEYRIAFDQFNGQSPYTLHNLITTITNEKSFIIGNELSRPETVGNLKLVSSALEAKAYLAGKLAEYEELEDEVKSAPDVRYCAGRAYLVVGDWQAAAHEFSEALRLSGHRDERAQKALVQVLELVLYH